MKRALTIVQRQGHERALHAIPRGKVAPADCSNCRNSRLEIQQGKFAFVCKAGFMCILGIAQTCPGYKDSRRPVLINFLQTI